MRFDAWFNKQDKVVQLVLLAIPGVNAIMELFIRLSIFLRTKDTMDLVVFIVSVIPFAGTVLGYVDLVYKILHNRFVLTK